MGFIETLKLALAAWVETLQSLRDFISWKKEYDKAKLMQEFHQTFATLDGPTSAQDKKDAAKKISDLISRL
jgi:hypothetical protein